MTVASGRKQNHLFVVKDHLKVGAAPKTTQGRGQILSPEQLTPEQRALITRYMKMSRTNGTLAGAMAGGSEWDLRPLTVQDGALTMVRLSDPELLMQKSSYQAMRDLHTYARSLLAQHGVLAIGEADGQLWMRRTFFQSTLADAKTLQLPEGQFPSTVGGLLALIRDLHARELFHGHLSLSNIALNGAQAVFLDYGFCAYATARPLYDQVAPEIKNGFSGSQASDIYDLGMVLRFFHEQRPLSPLQIECLSAMTAMNPSARPTIEAVIECFSESVQVPAEKPEVLDQRRKNRIGAGKLVPKLEKKEVAPFQPQRSTFAAQAAPQAVSQPVYQVPQAVPQAMPQQVAQHGSMMPGGMLQGAALQGMPQNNPALQQRVHQALTAMPMTQAVPEAVPVMQAQPRVHHMQAAPLEEYAAPRQQTQEKESSGSFGLLFIFAVLILGGVYYFRTYGMPHFSSRSMPPAIDANLEALWKSGQPSLMEEVALDALADTRSVASAIIIKDAQERNVRPSVKIELLRNAFNPVWEPELGDEERETVMRIALDGLVKQGNKDLLPIEQMHPGAVLAFVSEMNYEGGQKQLTKIPTTKMASLPAPYGPLFKQLGALSVDTMDHVYARAAAHIVLGNAVEPALERFLGPNDSLPILRKKLELLAPFFASQPRLGEQIFSYLDKRNGSAGEFFSWFDEEKGAEWDKVSRESKVSILMGQMPAASLSLEQYLDLLHIDVPPLREAALQRLVQEYLPVEMTPLLQFLASPANKLTRTQSLMLVPAMSMNGEDKHVYIGQWFDSAPDPQSVMGLLLSRSKLKKSDVFDVEASRYLINKDWDAALPNLVMLVTHPEPLARALAYGHFDPADPQGSKILKRMVTAEPNQRLREQIKRKLETYQLTK